MNRHPTFLISMLVVMVITFAAFFSPISKVEADAMIDCTPMRNENGTQTHLMPADSRRLS